MKETSQVKVRQSKLVRSDVVQVAAVSKDLCRGRRGAVPARGRSAVQQRERESAGTGTCEHRGPTMLPSLPGASHQDAWHGPGLCLRELSFITRSMIQDSLNVGRSGQDLPRLIQDFLARRASPMRSH